MKGICFLMRGSSPRLWEAKAKSRKGESKSCRESRTNPCLTWIATAGALAALEKTGQNAVEFLARHVTGDWGELPLEDRTENYLSLQHGFRLLSSYRTAAGETTLLTACWTTVWTQARRDVSSNLRQGRRSARAHSALFTQTHRLLFCQLYRILNCPGLFVSVRRTGKSRF